MAKPRKADLDLLDQLDSLGSEEQPAPSPSKTTSKPSAARNENEDLDDLEKMLATKPAQTNSRPATPRITSSTTSATTTQKFTPTSSAQQSTRTSGDEQDVREQAPQSVVVEQAPEVQPAASLEKAKSAGGGGGWWSSWGSIATAATAAVSEAQKLATQLQQNEEAQKWASQARSYGANLQHITGDLRSRALPTFTTLLSHIAPPISAHERLQIHSTHDILNYPSLDPIIYSTFSRVMSQVEGGDLLVIQRGSENRSRSRKESEPQGYRGGVLGGGGNGWTDGPWWRDEHVKRDLGCVTGLKEGTRLARVSAEAYAREFFDARGGVEEAAKKATEVLEESNPVRSSDIFLAIQAISYSAEKEFFADDAREKADEKQEGGVVDPETEAEELVVFAIYLHDPIHSLSFSSLSQPFPQKWAAWLDARSESAGESGGGGLPESILEIIQSGGVDPREWVAEWLEEILSLGVGVLAQRYVARRMGVGEGGLGRGKRRAAEEDVSGEAARAI